MLFTWKTNQTKTAQTAQKPRSIIQNLHGGDLILTTNDSDILDAIKQFMAFQSSEHMGH
jgi:hypothetical protein